MGVPETRNWRVRSGFRQREQGVKFGKSMRGNQIDWGKFSCCRLMIHTPSRRPLVPSDNFDNKRSLRLVSGNVAGEIYGRIAKTKFLSHADLYQ